MAAAPGVAMREPVYDDGWARLYQGDVRMVLREMEPESVNMCVTSPPYWSLRDYGIDPGVWGGDETHLHDWEAPNVVRGPAQAQGATSQRQGRANVAEQVARDREQGAFCSCGAWKGALGLEPTPELFVAHMVEVFRDVRRVLAKNGTLWLNCGDSYAGSTVGGESAAASTLVGTHNRARTPVSVSVRQTVQCKPKDLVGIPWMLAFALRADGWWLRQELIWAKPNPMPESVTDRCTKAHEYVFLLTKRERYYYDADAIRERSVCPEGSGNNTPYLVPGQRDGDNSNLGGSLHKIGPRESRNKRSVWTIPTEPTPEAHFATFPQALVEPCILAGSAPGGVVLDPFVGSGTSCLVAKRLGRKSFGIDLNADYLEIARKRIGAVSQPMEMGKAT